MKITNAETLNKILHRKTSSGLTVQEEIERSAKRKRLRPSVRAAVNQVFAAEIEESGKTVKFIIPAVCPKPRMTQRDKWQERPSVVRYRAFCDLARLSAPSDLPQNPDLVKLRIQIEVPKSWSKKKKQKMIGTPHRVKPDWDNLAKAVCDALWSEDSGIYKAEVEKIWGETSQIEVEVY